eukprot:4537370-Amphidinium_carterae.1
MVTRSASRGLSSTQFQRRMRHWMKRFAFHTSSTGLRGGVPGSTWVAAHIPTLDMHQASVSHTVSSASRSIPSS